MHSNTSGFLNRTNAKNILTELAELTERLIDKALDPCPGPRPGPRACGPALMGGDAGLHVAQPPSRREKAPWGVEWGAGVGADVARERLQLCASAWTRLGGPAGCSGLGLEWSLLLPGAEGDRVAQTGAQGGQRPESRSRVGILGAWGGEAGSG